MRGGEKVNQQFEKLVKEIDELYLHKEVTR